jgi:hypothetical protein
MTDSYRKALEDAKRKLLELVSQRDQIGVDIERLKAVIEALANMLDNPEDTSSELCEMESILGPGGLTDAVRRTLEASTARGMTPFVPVLTFLDMSTRLRPSTQFSSDSLRQMMQGPRLSTEMRLSISGRELGDFPGFA